MVNIIAQRLVELRDAMQKKNIDWYFCTSDDYHTSEYVADYFKIREHYTGFTGENAFLLLNKENAYMWADGRFFIQAEDELKGTGVTLMKMGEPGVPTVSEKIRESVKEGETLSFDGRMVSTALGKKIKDILTDNKANMVYEDDFAGELWKDRPSLPTSRLMVLSDDVTGESIDSKLKRIREKMEENKASYNFVACLDDIAWITNIRGNDIECNPVFLSYMLITKREAFLFMQKEEVSSEIKEYLTDKNVKIVDYDRVLSFLSEYDFEGSVLLDTSGVNYSCYKIISEKTKIVDKMNPSKLMKAIKNSTEIKRLREAYIEDSVCVSKFAYWLKKNVGKIEITEVSAAEYIDNLRSKVSDYIELSFPTISGYGPNAAMMHYSATPENHAVVKPEGMLLVDSGGQYLRGTTDVTRTFACGPVTDEMKLHYSKTAAGMLALADAKFLYGCTGRNVDILSRLPLWQLGIDYKCGTGHGVGYILNVHEGPHGIRWKYVEGAKEAVLEEGMIMSDEPGVYIEGSHGIRIENVIICLKDVNNSDGQFMKFEHLTFTPLDKDLIDTKYLTKEDIDRINAYHKAVFEKTASYFEGEELDWLKEATAPIK